MTQIPVEQYEQAMILLGLPVDKDGAVLISVHVEAGIVTGKYAMVSTIAHRAQEIEVSSSVVPTDRYGFPLPSGPSMWEGYAGE